MVTDRFPTDDDPTGESGPGLGGAASASEESRAEALYDLYLERALGGDTREPDRFLADQGVGPGALHDQLIDRLRQIRELAGGRGARVESAAGLPFERLGEFRLLDRIGAGAMGVVYLAEQTPLGRLVALKVLREELSGTADAERRFDREARALAAIQHPGVVRLYGFGRDRGVRYLAMELVPGESLAERIDRRGPLPAAEVARIGLDLARACARVHGAGLLHRDVKPSNVRLHADGHAVLLDLGLARGSGLESDRRTAGFVGSLGYAAPEQVRNNVALDGRADVYSIGATLWHALAGRPPFEGDDIDAVLHAVLSADLPPLRRVAPGVPIDLATVVGCAMEREPDRRYASAEALAADLEAVLALRPVAARPPGRLERVLKYARRNPVVCSSAATALLAVAALTVLIAVDDARRRGERLERARAELATARAAIERYRTEREATAALDRELRELAIEVEHGHLFAADRARYWELVDRVESARRERAGVGFVVADAMSRAVRLAPQTVDLAIEVRRELLREQWQDAAAGGSAGELRLIEQELRALETPASGPLLPRVPVTLDLAPGAEAWLFRLRELGELEPGGPQRQVPVPVELGPPAEAADGPGPPAPGAWVLRAARAADGVDEYDRVLALGGAPIEGGPFVRSAPEGSALRRGDRLVRVRGEPVPDPRAVELLLEDDLGLHAREALSDDGVEFLRDGTPQRAPVADLAGVRLWTAAERLHGEGGPVTLLREGARLEVSLPPGIDWRTSAFALAPLATNRIDAAGTLALPPGNYVLLARAPGCDPLRAHLPVGPESGGLRLVLRPRPRGTAPPGFVHMTGAGSELWVAEFEVTVAEYLAFLDDPAQRARTRAARAVGERGPVPARLERPGGRDLVWEVDPWGAVRVGPGVDPRLPVVGISKRDADDFVRWLDAGGVGGSARRGSFRLGTDGEHGLAGALAAGRAYSYGSRFDPQAGNTCFSRPVADVEPVGSHPVDESPLGIYDLCGNAAELADSYFDRSRRAWHAMGGSWAQAPAGVNRIFGGLGHRIDETAGDTGLRLFWRPAEDGR